MWNLLVCTVQDVTRKALLTSLRNDPHTTWVKGPSGKHTNVSALLDWPDDDTDDDDDNSDSEPLSSPPSSVTMTTFDGLHGDTAAGNQSQPLNTDGVASSTAGDDNQSSTTSVSK